jgi:hypothetical protein
MPGDGWITVMLATQHHSSPRPLAKQAASCMIETQQKHQAGDTIITGKEVVNVERRHKIIATKLNMHRVF